MTVADEATQEQTAREAIAAAIRAVATTARVHPVWVMGLVTNENANILRSDADRHPVSDEPRVHGYTVTRIKSAHTAKSKPQGTGVPSRRPTAAVAFDAAMTFRIKGVHWFEHGGDTGVHSENIFKAEITRIVKRLASLTRLGLDESVAGDLIQIDAEGFANYGKGLQHVSDLSITVHITEQVAAV